MPQQINRQVILLKRPTGLPDESCFQLVQSAIPEPADGQVLIQTQFLSVDPYMRGRMNDRKSYVPPFQLGEVLTGGVVGEVVVSKSNNFKQGDIVVGNLGWQDFSVAGERDVRSIEPGLAPHRRPDSLASAAEISDWLTSVGRIRAKPWWYQPRLEPWGRSWGKLPKCTIVVSLELRDLMRRSSI